MGPRSPLDLAAALLLVVAVACTSGSPEAADDTRPTLAESSSAIGAEEGVHAVDWSEATISLEACGLPGEVQVHGGSANFGGTIPEEAPRHMERSRDLGIGEPIFGDVTGDGHDEAFVGVMCGNGGGTAAGQTAYAIEVYTAGSDGGVALLGVLRPTQPDLPVHVPYMDDMTIEVEHGRVSAMELWYTAEDSTCCPSLRVDTTWAYRDGRFEHEHSTPPRRGEPLADAKREIVAQGFEPIDAESTFVELGFSAIVARGGCATGRCMTVFFYEDGQFVGHDAEG